VTGKKSEKEKEKRKKAVWPRKTTPEVGNFALIFLYTLSTKQTQHNTNHALTQALVNNSLVY